MKFVEKTEQSFIREIGIGSVIEYEIELLCDGGKTESSKIRDMVIGIEGGYRLMDIKDSCVFGPVYESLKSILDEYQNIKNFRIIKSENLELREV